ncbi:ribosomal protein S2 [Didymella exigua CBS 183.55]|uniref:Ribosomal protein S2 n=1 Tax=Didymella exigua CBS 183.55 TaxID=1150837 RepID=A0A6A5RRR6_9PLEO|nr:ribosomal protein S2 [Didymella exigua CBS 183.55]KAF1928986.1 ribosomal protein S2 [Didymella exigua CBS 183.55]
MAASSTMLIRHLVARRAPALARRSLQRRCYSTHTPDTGEDLPQTFAQKWQREWASGVGLDSPVAATEAPATAPSPAGLAEQYHAHKQQSQRLNSLGAVVEPHYQPHTLLTNPPSPADVTLELLLASEAHQGHATSLWNPANARYIHGIRQGIHVISLEVTAAHLRRAAKVVQEVSRRGGIVLFVGTRDGQDRAVSRAAELAKGYHLFERWIPGSITNGQQILGRCKTKVVNEHDKHVSGFEEQLYDRPVLRPDLVVCLNPLENYVLLHECALNNIPTIGVIDTNADPTWVTYPVPANDDSLRCIQVIAGVLGRAGEAGQKQRLAAAARGRITYRPAQGLMVFETEDGDREVAQAKSEAEAVVAARMPEVVSGAEVDADAEFSRHLDEVRDREDHRQKGGRRIKFSD